MRLLPESEFTFTSDFSRDEIDRRVKMVSLKEETRPFFPTINPSKQFEVFPKDHGFEIRERFMLAALGIKTSVYLSPSGNETEVRVKIRFWNPLTILFLFIWTAIAGLLVFVFWMLIGPFSLIFTGLPLLLIRLQFGHVSWQIRLLIIQKIFQKQIRRI